jgi:hypothetical protein
MFLLPEEDKEMFKIAVINEEKDLMASKHTTLKRGDTIKAEQNTGFSDYEKIVDIIFQEIVRSEKRRFIDYEEFEKVLWTTNIDQSCVIHLN